MAHDNYVHNKCKTHYIYRLGKKFLFGVCASIGMSGAATKPTAGAIER